MNTVSEHTTTAIVGPSGGGKTTPTSLMARFWDVKSGEVLLGGKNVRGFGAVAPFPVGEGVHGEMNECIKFQLLKSELSFRGYYAYQPSVKLHTVRLPK